MNEQPTNQELMNAILRMDGKLDAVHRKLDAKIDHAVEDLSATFNAFATDTNKRLMHLEAFHA